MAALTPQQRADLQEKLAEAEAVRHRWLTGKVSTSWSYGDRTVQYSVDGLKQIGRYIAELRRRLAGVRAVRTRVAYGVPD